MPKARTTSSAPTKKTVKERVKAQPTYDDIALRAYHIYLERDCAPGDPMQDWLQAERELTEQPSKPRRKPKVVSIAA